MAAAVLLRLHSLTNEAAYHDKAEQTLEVFASSASQYGIYAATYGMAAVWLLHGYTQVVVIGNDEKADQLYAAAVAPYAANKTVFRLRDSEVTPQDLPPALAETIPSVPGARSGRSVAVICTQFYLPAARGRTGRTRACFGGPLTQSLAGRISLSDDDLPDDRRNRADYSRYLCRTLDPGYCDLIRPIPNRPKGAAQSQKS